MSVNNVDKILQYIGPFCKHPVVLDGKQYYRFNVPKTHIKLAATFFNIDNCESCGRCCCITESVVLTEFEYQNLMNYTDEDFDNYGLNVDDLHSLKESILPEVHNINGKDITIYRHPERKQNMYVNSKGKDVDCCYHLFQADDGLYKCKIHPVRSITCRMPHNRVFYSEKHGSTSIGVSQFGRNWALGCPVQFTGCESEEKFNQIKASRLDMMEYLDKVANDINCETYLPEIIDYIEHITYDNFHEMVDKDILPVITTHYKKLF